MTHDPSKPRNITKAEAHAIREANKLEKEIEMSTEKKTAKAKGKGKTVAKAKAKPAKAEKTIAEAPRGFGSPESTTRVAKATADLRKRFPKMPAGDITAYLAEVGANRYNALAKYEPKGK